MKISIIQDDGVVGVDGVFRTVDLSGVNPEIRAIQFDTEKGIGNIEYDAGATIDAQARDFEAERDAQAAAGDDPVAQAALAPIYKTGLVRRPDEIIKDFTPWQ